MQHLVHIDDDVIKVDREWLQDLLAPKREQLTRKIGRAIARLLDFFKICFDRIVFGYALEREAAITINRRQQIIEIMRHSARQLADGFHLL